MNGNMGERECERRGQGLRRPKTWQLYAGFICDEGSMEELETCKGTWVSVSVIT
jgi:hypothetical protein